MAENNEAVHLSENYIDFLFLQSQKKHPVFLRSAQKAIPDKIKIHYHRSYRKLEQHSIAHVLFSMFILAGLVDYFILTHYSQITHIISRVARAVLSTCLSPELIQIEAKPYLMYNAYIVNLPGRYPSLLLSIIVALVSIVVIGVLYYSKKAIEPKRVWPVFIFFITLVSSLFFIFFPGFFPYDLEIFSEMYIKTEVGIWVIIPFILTIAFLPFRMKLLSKFLVIMATLFYSIVFACARYIVFLYFLRSATYLFMALMFFMFGPFLDFIYIVGSYSLCITHSAKKNQKDVELWNWLY